MPADGRNETFDFVVDGFRRQCADGEGWSRNADRKGLVSPAEDTCTAFARTGGRGNVHASFDDRVFYPPLAIFFFFSRTARPVLCTTTSNEATLLFQGCRFTSTTHEFTPSDASPPFESGVRIATARHALHVHFSCG